MYQSDPRKERRSRAVERVAPQQNTAEDIGYSIEGGATFPNFSTVMRQRYQAWASVKGSEAHPSVKGSVRFYQTAYGVLVVAELWGLPRGTGACDAPVFGFHIHEGGSCTGNGEDPFFDAGMHYNPAACQHPYHAGDLPVILGADGVAFSSFLTNRFTLEEILGKTVILHASADDFSTQPSGNSGAKIACGLIER